MNFTQLRAFNAVAKTGGFSRAADYLNVTQPAITRQLKALEADYGIALFHRRGHKLELTDSGADLFTVSQRIFSLLNEAGEIVTGESELRGGTLRVGADSPFYFMDILAAFKERYPSVSLTVTMSNANDLFRALRNFEVDVGIVTAIDVAPEFVGVTFTQLLLTILVPADHEWSARKSISLSELKGQPIILRESTSMTRKLFLQLIEFTDLEPFIVMELHDQVAVREAVAAGLGFAPELAGGMRQDERLRRISIIEAPTNCHEYITCHKDRFSLSKVQAFFDIAEAVGPVLVDRKILTAPEI
jgi:aminoethylphosphonate catabolism LysR family transcriptional regulator